MTVPIGAESTNALAFFLGSWLCHRRGTPTHVLHTTIVSTLRQTWLKADTYAAHSVDPKRPFVGTRYFGYSPVSQRYVAVNVNNFGGYWIEESPGWRGNRLVWADTSTEDGEIGTTFLTRTSPNAYMEHTELRRAGKPIPGPADLFCVRVSR